MEFEKWIAFAAKEERALTVVVDSGSEEEDHIKVGTGSPHCCRRPLCRRRRHASHGS